MKVLIIVNPVSGSEDKSDFMDFTRSVAYKYAIDLQTFFTTGEDDISKLKKEAEEFKPDRVLAVGGDGTVLLASQALLNLNIPVGIIPMGSANGMASELNISQDPNAAFMDAITTQYTKKIDLIKVNNKHYMLHLGDVGVNAEVVKRYSEEGSHGFFHYVKHFTREFFDASLFDAKITTPEDTYSCSLHSLIIANARKYGTGAVVNPKGDMFDGNMELVLIKDVGVLDVLAMGLSKIDESVSETLENTIVRCKKAKIEVHPSRNFQIDGEFLGKVSEINLEVIPAAVPILLIRRD